MTRSVLFPVALLLVVLLSGCASHRYNPHERPMTQAESEAYQTEIREVNETLREGFRGARDTMVEHERTKAARYAQRGRYPASPAAPAPQPPSAYYFPQPVTVRGMPAGSLAYCRYCRDGGGPHRGGHDWVRVR